MKLLEVTKVVEENKKSNQDRIQRVAKLNEEESAVVKRINRLRDHEKTEKQRVADELEDGQPKLVVKRSILAQEVESLESRKKDALKPVYERMNEANALYEANQKEIIDLVSRRVKIKETEEKLMEGFEIIKDREGELQIEERKLKSREKGIVAGENEIKRSTSELATKWVDYHSSINNFNTRIQEVETREKEVNDGQKTNEEFKKSLNKKEAEQTNHDRQISDRYATLGRAFEELERKKNGSKI